MAHVVDLARTLERLMGLGSCEWCMVVIVVVMVVVDVDAGCGGADVDFREGGRATLLEEEEETGSH